MKRILFIDRDGTIIREPADEQIDSFDKLRFVPGIIRNLAFIREKLDFRFVMVSNQDGLGTPAFPEDTFWPVHKFILQTLEDEGITFDDILIDPHFPEDNAPTRKPNTGMVEKYINDPELGKIKDLGKEAIIKQDDGFIKMLITKEEISDVKLMFSKINY